MKGTDCLERMANDLLEPLTLAERDNIVVVFERVLSLLESETSRQED